MVLKSSSRNVWQLSLQCPCGCLIPILHVLGMILQNHCNYCLRMQIEQKLGSLIANGRCIFAVKFCQNQMVFVGVTQMYRQQKCLLMSLNTGNGNIILPIINNKELRYENNKPTPWAIKTWHFTFVHIFASYWPIFKIFDWRTLRTTCNNVIIIYPTTRKSVSTPDL